MVFVDEVGASLKGVVSKTWAPAGETPSVPHCCKWKNLSSIGGITLQGDIFSQTYEHSIRNEQVIAFLKHMAKQVQGKLLVIWDGASIHRAHAVKNYLASDEGQRITVLSLPPYAPECNPIEWLWAWVKRNFLANLGARTLEELHTAWRRALAVASSRNDLVRSFFNASAVAALVQFV